MKIKNIKKYLALIILLLLMAPAILVVPAQAADPIQAILNNSGGAAVEGMNSIFSDLGVDKGEVKNSVQTMNASRQKQTSPQVSLEFSPSNPKLGDQLSATATPLYFINDIKKIYFTWFLKQKGCDRTDNPDATQKTKCDLNNDGRVDIEDYKIKAMRVLANDDFSWESADYSHSDGKSKHDAVYGGTDQQGKKAHCYVQDVQSGDVHEIGCNSHLFPDAPGQKTGDNSFGKDEEKFWHTDPTSADTAQSGNTDEANVAGLGLNKFSWNYTPGDRLGVVVEGSSIEPSQTRDASYRTMWAAPKGLCSNSTIQLGNNYPKVATVTLSTKADTPVSGETTTVVEKTTQELLSQQGDSGTVRTTVVDITTVTNTATGEVLSESTETISTKEETVDLSAENDLARKEGGRTVQEISNASDLNDCLYSNLVTPSENSPESNKIDVSLTYSPTSPINDPTAYGDPKLSNGDDIVVQSSISNATDNNYLQYSWEVFMSDDPNPDDWGSPLPKASLPGVTQMEGLGITSLKFKLNLAHPKKYLNVKLTVKENAGQSSSGDNFSRRGHTSVLIPITSSNNNIKIFSTLVSAVAPPNISTPYVSMNKEICTTGTEMAICPVTKNSIIGLKVNAASLTDFLWTINGAPVTNKECFYSDCNIDKQTGVAYFPALAEVGKNYTVALTATNQETGAKVSLSKTIQVIDPAITISSADESVCKPVLLGNYIDLKEKSWPDYSKTNFLGLADKPIKLQADVKGFTPLPGNLTWTVDGQEVTASNVATLGYTLDDTGGIILPAKALGEDYEVSATTFYAQDILTKNALNKYWGVSYDQFYEKKVSSKISIKLQASTDMVASAQAKKIMATIYSGTPAYLAFLLRIALTAFVILFLSQLTLTFFPKINSLD